MELVLEFNTKALKNNSNFVADNLMVMVTPLLDEDFWIFRVMVSETQSIVGFPKFTTICIGFAHEEDWNTNLPYTFDTKTIFDHISHNKGDDKIKDADCIQAIKLVQSAASDMDTSKITPTPWAHTFGSGLIYSEKKEMTVLFSSPSITPEETEGNAAAIVSAVNNTYGVGINPEAVNDLLDVVQKFLEVTETRWRSLPATSYEKNIISSAKAAITKSKL